MCSCSCQYPTTIMKRMKQATLFGFFALNMLIILCLPCLSDWFASHHTLCLQESSIQVNQRVFKQLVLSTLHIQGGWLATQSTPPLEWGGEAEGKGRGGGKGRGEKGGTCKHVHDLDHQFSSVWLLIAHIFPMTFDPFVSHMLWMQVTKIWLEWLKFHVVRLSLEVSWDEIQMCPTYSYLQDRWTHQTGTRSLELKVEQATNWL